MNTYAVIDFETTGLSPEFDRIIRHLDLATPDGMRAHRALADSLMTVELWKHLMQRIESQLPGYEPDVDFVAKLSRTPKAKVNWFLSRSAKRMGCTPATYTSRGQA